MVVEDNALLQQIKGLGEPQLREMLNYLVLLNSEAVHNALLYVQRGNGVEPTPSIGPSDRSTRSVFASSDGATSSSRKIVVLCTYTPTSKRQLKKQDRAMEICKRHSIRPEIVLGTNPDEVEKCYRLFQISGMRDSYPQFFLKEPDGDVQFLGDLHTVENMVAEGSFTTDNLNIEDASATSSKKAAEASEGQVLEQHQQQQMHQQQGAPTRIQPNSQSTTPGFLAGMHQPEVMLDEDNASLETRDVFNPGTRPKSDSVQSPQPPPPKSHRTPDMDQITDRKVVQEVVTLKPAPGPRAEEGVNHNAPSWMKNATSSAPHQEQPTSANDHMASMQQPVQPQQPSNEGPAWMQNVQQQAVPAPPPPPPAPTPAPAPPQNLPSASHPRAPSVGEFHSSTDTMDLDVITEGDESDASPQQGKAERRKSAKEIFPVGGACYLVYHPVHGELNIHYSEYPIDGAVGVWTSPDIEMFKQAQGLGTSELIGNCATQVNDRRNYYNGWTQFIKAGKSMEGTITVLDVGLPVDFYGYQEGYSYKCRPTFETTNLDAVACVPKYHDFNTDLEGKKWTKEAKKIGAVAQFRALSPRPKTGPPQQRPAFAASPTRESAGVVSGAMMPPGPAVANPVYSGEAVAAPPSYYAGEEALMTNTVAAPPTATPRNSMVQQQEIPVAPLPAPEPVFSPPVQVPGPVPAPPAVVAAGAVPVPAPPPVPVPAPAPVPVPQVPAPVPESVPLSPARIPTEPPAVDYAAGACYLIYDPASSGQLVVHYSKTRIDNAIGMWTPGPGKSITGFKFKQNLGKSVLIGSCASGVQGRKNYCSGWCQFVRLAMILDGTVTLWDPTVKGLKVDVWIYRTKAEPALQSVKLPQGVPVRIGSISGIACIPKHTPFYDGMGVDILKWLADAGNIGASSRCV